MAAAALIVGGDGRRIALEPLPPFPRALIADGGLVPHLEKRLAAGHGLDALVGTPEMLAAGDAYDAERFDG